MEQPRITTLWNVFSTSSGISPSSTLFTSDRWITSSQQMLLSSLVSFLNSLLQAASEDIPIVRRPDRKDLLGYLKVFLRLKPNFCHSGHVHCSGRSCLCSFHWSLGSFGDANPGTFSSLKKNIGFNENWPRWNEEQRTAQNQRQSGWEMIQWLIRRLRSLF